ncbi:MAG: DUF805 domain-containing protein [Pseudomonadota bacterium]
MAAGPQTVSWALFSWRGRIRRATFALGTVLLLTVLWVCVAQVAAHQGNDSMEVFWALSFIVCGLVSLYCVCALGAKRIHDIGYPGWLIVPMFLTGLYIIVVLALCFWPGERHDNKYGPPPVAPQ